MRRGLVSSAVILSQRGNAEISTTGGQKRLELRVGSSVFEENKTTLASLASASGTRVGLMRASHAVGGCAAERSRLVAGDIGEEL
jgi:type IV secretory pathway TrbL component